MCSAGVCAGLAPARGTPLCVVCVCRIGCIVPWCALKSQRVQCVPCWVCAVLGVLGVVCVPCAAVCPSVPVMGAKYVRGAYLAALCAVRGVLCGVLCSGCYAGDTCTRYAWCRVQVCGVAGVIIWVYSRRGCRPSVRLRTVQIARPVWCRSPWPSAAPSVYWVCRRSRHPDRVCWVHPAHVRTWRRDPDRAALGSILAYRDNLTL